MWHYNTLVLQPLLCLLALARPGHTVLAAERNYRLEQAAIHQATAAVADSVVQITTVGGLDRVGKTLIAQGPTTGLIVSEDGYIVSSEFNFAQQPSSILVRLPDGQQVPAEIIAHDHNYMLVLLKVETEATLPVPAAVPREAMAVGQWAIAMGRTFQSDRVDASLGVISALNRMHGRVVQTDANVSAANYGGPLVDIRGRVFGILVPMAPEAVKGEGPSELAGAEFYDSGIGFAVPLERINRILPRWQTGEDLHPGRLGIALQGGAPYIEPAVVASVWPGSPAAKAGWQSGDKIIAVDGQAVETQAQLQFHLRPRYAGDSLTVSLERTRNTGQEEVDTEITLIDQLPPYRHSFLGILPGANAQGEATGFVVAGVWPASPAAVAGVQSGDLVTKINSQPTPRFASAKTLLRGLQPGEDVDLTIARDGERLELPITLAALPEDILAATDLPSSEPPRSSHLLEVKSLKLPEFAQEAFYLLPEGTPETSVTLLIWLGSGVEEKRKTLLDEWQTICQREDIALLIAEPTSESGWGAEDMDYLKKLLRTIPAQLRIAASRTVIGGEEKAGQLAYALALKGRARFRGVVVENAPLPRTLQIPENSPTQQLNVLAVVPQNTTLAPLIQHDIQLLRDSGRPVSTLQKLSSRPTSTLFDPMVRSAIVRWLKGLRRL